MAPKEEYKRPPRQWGQHFQGNPSCASSFNMEGRQGEWIKGHLGVVWVHQKVCNTSKETLASQFILSVDGGRDKIGLAWQSVPSMDGGREREHSSSHNRRTLRTLIKLPIVRLSVPVVSRWLYDLETGHFRRG